MTRLSHVISAVYDRPWFVREQTLSTIDSIVAMHVRGDRLSPDEVRAQVDAASVAVGPRGGARTVGAVGVIPVYGPIMPRANIMSEYSGGATISSLRESFRDALADDAIGTILFDVDSPGGYTDGVDELATEIREARGKKPIVAISNYMMASAALYLMSGADEIVASPSSEVGWIGCVQVHQEFSRALDSEGVTTNILRDPAGKYGGNPYEPLSDKARTEIMAVISERSAQFHTAVAKGRGVTVAKVKSDFGQGGGMTATRAKAVGMVDRVESFDDTIRRLATGRGPVPGARKVAIQHFGVDGHPISTAEAITQPQTDPTAEAAFDDRASMSPNAGPLDEPLIPDQSKEAEAALALARAQANR